MRRRRDVEADAQFQMSWIDKFRLVAEVAPVLAKLQLAFANGDPHEQALALLEAGSWCADKTVTEIDNEAVEHIEAVIRTPEGKKLVYWFAAKLGVTANG